MKKYKILSANTIKILAVICMIIDHIGYMILPQIKLLNIIGRLAFPLFAYFIAEGCKYTKNKLKHFMLILSLGVLFQSVYFIYFGVVGLLNIFLTFSVSIFLIYVLEEVKISFYESKKLFALNAFIFLACILVVFVVCKRVQIDYGFFGVMLPVWISFTYSPNTRYAKKYKKIDNDNLRLIVFALGIILLAFFNRINSYLIFGILAVPVMLLYNGKKGKYNLKYFFYVIYPLHMVVIHFLSRII